MKKIRSMAFFMSAVMALSMVQGCGQKEAEQETKELVNVEFPLKEQVTYDIVGKRYAHSKPYGEYEEWNKQF